MDLIETDHGATHAQLAEIISLRDYMAMAAMPAILDLCTKIPREINVDLNTDSIAFYSYKMAEAMLKEREKHDSNS